MASLPNPKTRHLRRVAEHADVEDATEEVINGEIIIMPTREAGRTLGSYGELAQALW